MNICINVYGQQRAIELFSETLKQIIDDKHKFTILYTGWNTEEQLFEKYFPDSYINRIDKNQDIINNYIDKYKHINVDPTNPTKNIEHIITGCYIKKMSIDTIQKYCNEKSITFDLIISTRTDLFIYYNNLINYDEILINGLNKVYIPNGLDWDIYNEGACNNTFIIANFSNTILIMDQINTLNNTLVLSNNTHHPETSYYKHLLYNNLCLYRMNTKCFAYQLKHVSWVIQD